MKKNTGLVVMMLGILLLSGCGRSADPIGKIPEGETPAASAAPAKAAPAAAPSEKPAHDLIIKQGGALYTYEDLTGDIASLREMYGDKVQIINVCGTFDRRVVYDVVVGDPDSRDQILVFGAMHAREYITTQIVMNQLCDCLEVLNGEKTEEFGGVPAKELLAGTAVHFVPMANPDGVAIAQFGPEGLRTQEARDRVMNIAAANGSSDYSQWKANAEGVDINRNFDAGWEEYAGAGVPAPERYKGTAPGSAPEAAGLIGLTRDFGFRRTISYHTKGSLIYWYYLQPDSVLEQSRSFAQAIADVTGYALDGDYTAVDAAGYKDWAVYRMGIPSVTIEVGGEAPGNPVPYEYFDSIWEKNRSVVWAALYHMKYSAD